MVEIVCQGSVDVGQRQVIFGADVVGAFSQTFVPDRDVLHRDAVAGNAGFPAADAGCDLNVAIKNRAIMVGYVSNGFRVRTMPFRVIGRVAFLSEVVRPGTTNRSVSPFSNAAILCRNRVAFCKSAYRLHFPLQEVLAPSGQGLTLTLRTNKLRDGCELRRFPVDGRPQESAIPSGGREKSLLSGWQSGKKGS